MSPSEPISNTAENSTEEASIPKPTDPLAKFVPKSKKALALRKLLNLPPAVKHLARIYVNVANGDMITALRWVIPGKSEEVYREFAKVVWTRENVRNAIDEEYRAIGVDEISKKRYIGELWKSYYEGNQKTKQVVLGLLGRALGIGEMADETRVPVDLPIKNMEEGWRRMEGKDAIAAQNPTGFSKLEKEEVLPED